MHHIFIYSSVNGHLGCIHRLAIVLVNSAAMNIGMHVSFQIMVFSRCMPKSGIPGSCGSSILSFFVVFFLKGTLFIYLFILAVLGLCFCARAFSSCGERGPLFIAVRGPLTVAVSLVAEHKLQMRRLSSCGSRA